MYFSTSFLIMQIAEIVRERNGLKEKANNLSRNLHESNLESKASRYDELEMIEIIIHFTQSLIQSLSSSSLLSITANKGKPNDVGLFTYQGNHHEIGFRSRTGKEIIQSKPRDNQLFDKREGHPAAENSGNGDRNWSFETPACCQSRCLGNDQETAGWKAKQVSYLQFSFVGRSWAF